MRTHTLLYTIAVVLTGMFSAFGCASTSDEVEVVGESWAMHVIDSTSNGADGVRLADFDGDGHLDIVTAWEEGGRIRVYRNPGPTGAREPWPNVTVGAVDSPEDAFFVDLDGDGNLDVVSLTEGTDRTVYVHWAPSDPEQYLNPDAWTTEAVPDSRGRMQWMFGFPLALRDTALPDVVLTAKNTGAELGWYETGDSPRDLAQWAWHTITPVGWAMTIMPVDMNGDGRLDILLSDRKNVPADSVFLRAIRWLENPGCDSDSALRSHWPNHFIGGQDDEVMFLAYDDLDGDGLDDIIVPTRTGPILVFTRTADTPDDWHLTRLPMPLNTGTGKSAAIGDVNGDGINEIVVTCENARDGRIGVFYLSRRSSVDDAWTAHNIGGPRGVKYDLVRLIDLDHDGDLDVLTCEETEGLGVIWYENPTISRGATE